jgi:transposase-like protein
MKRIFMGLSVLMITLMFALKTQAQNVTISGEGLSPLTITKGMFADMKQVVIMAKAHDEKVHRYSGVTIADLLTKAGVTLGDSAKKHTVTSYIIVTAADNYKAIYTLAEIDPLFANRSIILADKADKKVLPVQDGPFQIIVPGEKKHGRWIRQVTGIEVVQVK